MKGTLEDLWHGNINPQENSRNNTPEMKQLMEYMARSAYDQFFTMGTYADDYKVDVINTSIKALYNKTNNPYAGLTTEELRKLAESNDN